MDRQEESSRPAPEQAGIGRVMASHANLKITAHSKSRLVALAHGIDKVTGTEYEALLKFPC